MANWKEVTERWLPIVEKMEEHDMDDYAIPEIYRAAEKAIDELLEGLDAYAAEAEWTAEVFLQGENIDGSEWEIVDDLDSEKVWNRDEHGWMLAQEVIHKHKGD